MICPVCKNKSNNVKECDKCKFKFEFFINKPTPEQQSDYDRSINEYKKRLEKRRNPNPHRISTPKNIQSIKKTPKESTRKIGKIERSTPVSYGKKEKYETEVEYQRRHLEYGYVKEHGYIIYSFDEAFNASDNMLVLQTDINEKFSRSAKKYPSQKFPVLS